RSPAMRRACSATHRRRSSCRRRCRSCGARESAEFRAECWPLLIRSHVMWIDAETRWHRIMIAMFIAAAALVATALYGVWTGDDLRGIVMPLVPAAIAALLGLAARRQRDRFAFDLPPTALDWVIRGVGLAMVALLVLGIVLLEPAPSHRAVDT